MMASVTTVNSTPVPSVSVATLSQSPLTIANSQASGTLTIPVVNSTITATNAATPATTVNTTNSHSSTLNVNMLPADNSQVIQVLNKQRLQDLIREVDSNVHPDEDVEELLLHIADEFIDEVVDISCKLAKHRNSDKLEVKDVQLGLEKNWNMWIPGFGGEELRPYKKSAITDAHRQRMNLIKRQKK